jgi:aryl-alcohol dehydrogenase-like predicted oxidoreductase
MERRILKGTDLDVSRLCFGTMTFGKPLDQVGATAMVDRAIAAGIDHFDTANAYQRGLSEEMLGVAIRGRRDRLVISSKVQHRMGDGPDDVGLSRTAIFKQIDASLARLGTDRLDLYYLHQPDWAVPIEETMEAMEALVACGKIRHWGVSNHAGWQVAEMHGIARARGWRAPSVAQMMYSLVARGIEQEFTAMARRFGVSIIAYNPLAAGLLTGKHDFAAIARGTRFDANPLYQGRYWHEEDFVAVDALKTVAAAEGRSLLSLAFGWLLHHTDTDCVILGASRLEQLEQNLAAAEDGPLSAEAVEACDRVWATFRGPSPIYNR